jgi:serine/threonine-protein phosphatase 2B catalytic subunit
VIQKYDEDLYEMIMDLFDCLPVSCIIDKKFFCMHGGISPDLNKVEELNTEINRFREPPLEGLFWYDLKN